jgi:DNA-binding transcriptional LysR family regulator
MELTHMRYFAALAETESVAKAAQQLHISSPSLSNAIKKTEAELGVKLFEPAGRGIRLTETGKAFYSRIKPLLDGIDLAIRETTQRCDVGVIINVATAWSDMLIDFTAKRPDIHLRTTVASSRRANERLAANEYDFWITTAVAEKYRDFLDMRELCTNSLTLAVHESHPLAQRESVSLPELKDETFLFPINPSTAYNDHLQLCQTAGFEPKIAACVNPQTRLGMVLRNEGLTFLESIENSNSLLRGIALVKLSDLPPRPPCYICSRKERRLSPNAQAFLNFALRYYRND